MNKMIKLYVVGLLILLLLVPIPTRLKDGGTVIYKSLIYTVTKYHTLDVDTNSKTGYVDGSKIEIFGLEIYNSFEKKGKVFTATDYAYDSLESLPKNYGLEEAVKDECFVVSLNKKYNTYIYSNFMSNVKEKKDAFIRAIYFTDEGDMIIRDIEYENDTEEFYVTIDNSRDKFSSQNDRKIIKYTFTDMIQEKNDNGKYTYFKNKDNKEKMLVLYTPVSLNSFIAKVIEEKSTYMIVEPNEDEEEKKIANKIKIKYEIEHVDYVYGVGTKVLIAYEKYVKTEDYFEIVTNDISTEGYEKFELHVKTNDKNEKIKVLNNKKINKNNANFDLYYYGIDEVKVMVDDKSILLEDALKSEKITLDGIIINSNMQVDEAKKKYENLETHQSSSLIFPYVNEYDDGGSIIYCYENFKLIKYHTLDGNRDVYIGNNEMNIDVINKE